MCYTATFQNYRLTNADNQGEVKKVKKLAIVAALLVALVLGYGWHEMSRPIYLNIDDYGTHLYNSWTMKPYLSMCEDDKAMGEELIVAKSRILFWLGPQYYLGRTNGYMDAPMKLQRCKVIWQYKYRDELVKDERLGDYTLRTQVVATTKGCLTVPWVIEGRRLYMKCRTGDIDFGWRSKKMVTNRLDDEASLWVYRFDADHPDESGPSESDLRYQRRSNEDGDRYYAGNRK